MGDQLFDRVQTATEGGHVGQRIGQPVGHQSRAHRRDRAIEHGQQRTLAAAVADRAGQLQAAAARFVDLHRRADAIRHQPVDVFQRTLLRFREIVEHGPGGADRLIVSHGRVEAKAVEPSHSKMLGQRLAGGVGGKRPVGPLGRHHPLAEIRRQRLGRLAHQALGRGDASHLVQQFASREAGRHETAGRQLHPSQPDRIAGGDGGQIVALARIEQGVVGHRAGADHAGDFTAYEALGLLGIFHLIADRRTVAGGDELAQIALQLMVGKAGHRRGVLPLVAAGQGKAQRAGRHLGVLEEHLIKIAHPEQEQGVGTRLLCFQILLHHGSGGSGHSEDRKGVYGSFQHNLGTAQPRSAAAKPALYRSAPEAARSPDAAVPQRVAGAARRKRSEWAVSERRRSRRKAAHECHEGTRILSWEKRRLQTPTQQHAPREVPSSFFSPSFFFRFLFFLS